MSLKYYDVVLLPPDDMARQSIELSKRLSERQVGFVLDGVNCFPHLSLYMLQIPDYKLDESREALREIAEKFKPIWLEASKYNFSWGYLDVEFDRTDEADHLQHEVLAALNPLRDGMRKKDAERAAMSEGVAQQNYDEFGYRYAGELFRPHITLTRFLDEDPLDDSTLPHSGQFKGSFSKIGLFELGNDDTCIRKIFDFDLTGY